MTLKINCTRKYPCIVNPDKYIAETVYKQVVHFQMGGITGKIYTVPGDIYIIVQL